MLSLKGRVISFLLRNRSLLKFRPTKEIIDWNKYEAVLNFRNDVERGAGKFGKLPEGIEIIPYNINSLYTEWIIPAGAEKDPVILYFHGGGYVSGTCKAHRTIVSKFVKNSGVAALLFEYRLAPENRFPAALDDALAAYHFLLSHGISPERIIFVGDSSGGGLCLSSLLALRDKGNPLPAAAVVYSPVTDFNCTGQSYLTKAKVCLSPVGSALAFGKHYAGENDPGLPYISPLYGELHGLPPMLIYAGEDEVLCDDSVRFAEKAKAAGVDVTLHIGKGLFHCYPAMAPLFPEARKAMNEMCDFIKTKTASH